MNATYVVTRREGRFRTLADEVEIDHAYRLAGFILGDTREAEDATQDALARAWWQRSSLRRSGAETGDPARKVTVSVRCAPRGRSSAET
jgi:hypothetical protein